MWIVHGWLDDSEAGGELTGMVGGETRSRREREGIETTRVQVSVEGSRCAPLLSPLTSLSLRCSFFELLNCQRGRSIRSLDSQRLRRVVTVVSTVRIVDLSFRRRLYRTPYHTSLTSLRSSRHLRRSPTRPFLFPPPLQCLRPILKSLLRSLCPLP